jgi:hypothetical protein
LSGKGRSTHECPGPAQTGSLGPVVQGGFALDLESIPHDLLVVWWQRHSIFSLPSTAFNSFTRYRLLDTSTGFSLERAVFSGIWCKLLHVSSNATRDTCL